MAAVRGRGNRSTEARLRLGLVRAGICGWKLHPKDVPGRPDFYFPEKRLAVFVDGCFWHGCPQCGHLPRVNPAFWTAKIRRNRERDSEMSARLESAGVKVKRLWEHELNGDLAIVLEELRLSRLS